MHNYFETTDSSSAKSFSKIGQQFPYELDVSFTYLSNVNYGVKRSLNQRKLEFLENREIKGEATMVH